MWKNLMRADAVLVPGRFIDEYMKQANGEFVKVYLYLLRRGPEQAEAEEIADALDMTGADVRRALAYWKKAGVLEEDTPETRTEKPAEKAEEKAAGEACEVPDTAEKVPVQDKDSRENAGSAPAAKDNRQKKPPKPERRTVDMAALGGDEEFKQLLYIAQQYLNKLFTQTDTEILGNLYQNLGMSAELLEYLMEYCAENRHTSLRYAETVALNWKDRGIRTAEEAREASRSYNRRVFAVMKAMGLNDRNPGNSEKESIRRWFEEFGFDEKIVIEACNRTLERIHKPSFPYAERILRDWKDAGVKTFSDIEAQDRARSTEEERRTRDGGRNPRKTGGQKATRFDNFESHGYDYDKMVWNMISRSAGGNDGTE